MANLSSRIPLSQLTSDRLSLYLALLKLDLNSKSYLYRVSVGVYHSLLLEVSREDELLLQPSPPDPTEDRG
jgi:hypothetical protein